LAVLPFVSLPLLFCGGIIPWAALLPRLLLPMLWKNVKTGMEAKTGNREKLLLLELMGVKLHLSFGVLMIVGILIGTVINNS
jgi:1,4-dihydroxy-2-naphthoate octaprenyltransferase